jgi:hypothetical protein
VGVVLATASATETTFKLYPLSSCAVSYVLQTRQSGSRPLFGLR